MIIAVIVTGVVLAGQMISPPRSQYGLPQNVEGFSTIEAPSNPTLTPRESDYIDTATIAVYRDRLGRDVSIALFDCHNNSDTAFVMALVGACVSASNMTLVDEVSSDWSHADLLTNQVALRIAWKETQILVLYGESREAVNQLYEEICTVVT